jgi:hypothetical protein
MEVVRWGRNAAEARRSGEPLPPPPATGGNYNSATVLESQQPGGPVVNLLTRDQSVTWFFKTREGAEGILQLVSISDNPSVVKIRYKLIQPADGEGAPAAAAAHNTASDDFANRFEAASMMTDFAGRNEALGRLAVDAAKAGDVKITGQALEQINDFSTRGQASLEAVRALVKRGLKKQALQIAKNISDFAVRDQALAELAH